MVGDSESELSDEEESGEEELMLIKPSSNSDNLKLIATDTDPCGETTNC